MLKYIAKRALQAVPLVIGITIISFILIQAAPGDPFSELSQNPQISEQTLQDLRVRFGFDRPLVIQYLKWFWGMLRLDFGYSTSYHIPVITLIGQRLFNTLYLAVISLVLTWAIAIPIGIYSARHQYQLGDRIFSVLTFIGMSLPTFFVAFLFIYVASHTTWLPTGGVRDPIYFDMMSPLEKTWDLFRHLLIPISVLVASSVAGLVRLMRGNMLDVLKLPYVTTARAKGLSEFKVIYKHALRNAVNPMITIFGYQLSGLLSGVALTEAILSWPGLGRLMLDAVLKQDVYLVMATLVISSCLLIISNLFADILLAVTDPRVRYQS
ncbi:ABC transporter permease [PVC group bacterium]|nr:ABC transporter permease [PVC group bacterium]